jgi:hypothetical protein
MDAARAAERAAERAVEVAAVAVMGPRVAAWGADALAEKLR